MTEEKDLRQFIITRFIATVAVVTVIESVFTMFLTLFVLPIVYELFLSDLNGLSLAEIWNMSRFSKIAIIVAALGAFIMVVLPFAAGAVIFSRLVTGEIRKLEEARENERKENEKKRYLMISDIAHDLKTPMTTVSGYAKALSDGVVREDQRQEYLDAISNKTGRMNDIIQMLFNYVRLDSQGFELVTKDTDLCELVRETVSSLYQDIEDAGDELDIDIPETSMILKLDKIQFGRVITNLITNAYKHNEKGTDIKVSVTRDTDEIRIYVADSGKLIEKELADEIFEPFTMGDKSRSSGGGSGLGLSVAKKIVGLHGYKIKLVQAPEVARYGLGDQYKKAFVIIINDLS
ncbi:MAG: HAMP domain-containing histidine kinase [Clostridiales bacterium]|nr:HAMP domain-containing histidine kinase [Clostridiales bacterium]